MTVLTVNLTPEYNIYIGKNLLEKAGELLDLDRKVLVVTDGGVPKEYAEAVASQCGKATVVTLPQGEGTKCLDSFSALLAAMLEHGFTRKDCVCAVGGGVVGDLSGFAASAYMRGIDFYNIPTTVLSQVDSSVGGKTGIDFMGVKNTVGAFKQPCAVLADTDTLKTLPERQLSNGLAEAIKMALTLDADLFSSIEKGKADLEEIIIRSVELKKRIVEQDEKEGGLRRVLNFGHTLGHGIESLGAELYHGECVALGMLPMCSDEVKNRLIPILRRYDLPTELDFDREKALYAVLHDKKAGENGICAVFCDGVGKFRFDNVSVEKLGELIQKI